MKKLIFAALLLSGTATADDLTIPNTFTAGPPARAAEVNENFGAVESSVDDNAMDVTDTAQALATVSTNVSSNTANIEAVTQAVSALVDTSQYEFVGFSTGTSDANVGLYRLNAVCQEDYGPDSRMARSDEVVEANSVPVMTTIAAWVRPVIIQASSRGSSGGVRIWDYSGVWNDLSALSCGYGPGATQVALESNGKFSSRDCSTVVQVACSAAQ